MLFDVPPVTGGNGGDLYALTLGANWNVKPKIIIRPEIRYDWARYDNGWKPFGGQDGTLKTGRKSEQLAGGGSVIVVF